ncbi:MAG: hypothetical protein PVI43_01715 [Candidatus Bathyarchaeota archaeon]|jgi:hypothetical protein
MDANKIKVFDDFYAVSRLLDDDLEIVYQFICAKIEEQRYTRKQIKRYITKANYMMLDKEIDYLLSLSMDEYITFKKRQKTIYDFLDK